MRSRADYVHPAAQIESLESRHLLSSGLTAAFAAPVPPQLPPTGTTHVGLRLTDNGSGLYTGPATIRLYASSDSTLGSGDVLLATVQRNIRLNPKAGVAVPISFAAPSGLANGEYFLLAQVNDSTIAVTPNAISFANPFSDAAVQFGDVPAQPVAIDGASAGQRLASVTITNAGNIPVHGSANLSFYLSADAVLDASDPLLATVLDKPVSLKPGGHEAVSFRIAVPPDTAAGAYFLFAVMSPSAALHDSNLADNVAISSQRVAVVTSLPQPTKVVNRITNVTNYTTVTNYAYCDEPGDCTDAYSDDSFGGDASDSSGSASDDDGQRDGSSSDSASDHSSSSDDSDSGDYVTSGGDF